MGLVFNWLKDSFSLNKEQKFNKTMNGVYAADTLSANIFYKELAIRSCTSIIANALVMSEFKTFEKGEETRKDTHYFLNVQPNKNQNAAEFWNEVVTKMIYDNECLVVNIDDEFFVADDFTPTEYVYYKNTYKNVVVKGLPIKRTFDEEDVFYFKLNDKNIKKMIDGLFNDYSTLLTAAIKSYKKANGFKGILKIDSMMPQDDESKAALEDLISNQFKKYIENDNALLPLSDGMQLIESDKSKGTAKDTRDVKKLIDDILEFVCMATKVPIGLVKGDVAGVSEMTDNFLMLCINPFAKILQTEINRKLYSKKQYLQRTYLKIDTQKIRLVDLGKLATAADLLFRIGVHNRDDNRELVGKERLGTEDSMMYYVTKNYETVVGKNEALKGGEMDGEHGNEDRQPTDQEF